jgi:hypothetical protein
MEAEPTQHSALPATSPLWAQYYARARELRKLGRGQHVSLKLEIKRRRRQSNLMIAVSMAALVAVVAAFYAILGNPRGLEPEGRGATPPSQTA